MNDPPDVGVGHRVADVDQAVEEFAERERTLASVARSGVAGRVVVGLEVLVDRLLERSAPDEPHRVVGAAVGILAQAVDRHNPRMLEPAGNLGLDQEAGATLGAVGVPELDLLESHLATELLIQSNEDLAQAPARVRAKRPVAHGSFGILTRRVDARHTRGRAEIDRGSFALTRLDRLGHSLSRQVGDRIGSARYRDGRVNVGRQQIRDGRSHFLGRLRI